jgi:arginine:ornithine antiporter/lysine permease
MLYSAGPQFLLMSTNMFALGVPAFIWARRESHPNEPVFNSYEKIATALLLVVAIIALALFLNGTVKIS